MIRMRFVLLTVAIFGFLSHALADDDTMPSPEDYLNDALTFIEENAYFIDNIDDWDALRQQALDMIQNATTSDETYAAIRTVLSELRDGHSFFLSASQLEFYEANAIDGAGFVHDVYSGVVWLVYDDSPASEAGIRVGDILREINGVSLSTTPRFFTGDYAATLTFERPGAADQIVIELEPGEFQSALLPHTFQLDTVGYIELPGLTSPEIFDTYTQTAQEFLRTMPDTTCGIILDLRRNTGGNMWPMIVGIGSLLGENESPGAFITRDGEQSNWFYADNTAGIGNEVVFELASTDAPLLLANLPVAVLTGNYTVSSGEMTLIAFLGRENTRIFGQATRGATSSNQSLPLPDGAEIILATAMAADRNGMMYPEGIEPDETIEIQWATFGTSDDPVIIRAKQWLETTCAGQN